MSPRIALSYAKSMVNNNQNTTYNFGRDVFNNNTITNNIYLTQAEVCCCFFRQAPANYSNEPHSRIS